MKNIFKIFSVILLAGFIYSCNNDDDYYNYYYKTVSIDSIDFHNDTMQVFNTQKLYTYTTMETGCEQFYGYDYQRAGNTRTVVGYSLVVDKTCTQVPYVSEDYINFRPEYSGTYHFKFYAGEDEEGNDLFIEQDIVVVE